MAMDIDVIRPGMDRCPVTGLAIFTSSRWCDIELTQDYSVSFFLIGSQVLLVVPAGHSGLEGVELLFEARARFIREVGLADREYVEIKDYSGLEGHITREARQQTTEHLMSEKNLKGFISLQAPFLVKLAINVARRFYSPRFKVYCTSHYENAIRLALTLLDSEEESGEGGQPQQVDVDRLNSDVDALFRFISSTGWDRAGEVGDVYFDDSHILKPVYESFLLIKQDFNDVLERYKGADRFNRLRAEIWKLAADETLSEDELIDKMVRMTGPLLGGCRFCYSRFSEGKGGKSELVTVYEWCREGVKPTLGEKTPSIIVKNFIDKGVIELNMKSALSLTPPPLQPIMKPILKTMVKSQNLESVLIFPYYHNGDLRGWFTVDICRDDDRESLSSEARSIVHDVVSILTSYIEKREAQEELKRAYREMESKVKDRTRELLRKNSLLEERDVELLEKNSVLQTSLDILSHDTKNLFFNIQILVKQLNETQIKRLIEEGIKELFEITMEAAGIMVAKKRILSLTETVSKIRVTGERLAIGRHHRIKLFYSNPNLLFVETSGLFKNAISNLVENALKYSPEEEPVEIVMDYVEGDILMHFKDRGPGVPDSEKGRIFEKFYRIDIHKTVGGTGRGLWITKNIIKKEGGCLTIADNPGGGAVFTIRVPAFKVDNMEEKLGELAIWFDLTLDKVKQKADSVRTMLIMNESCTEGLDTMVFNTLLTHLREEGQQKSMEAVVAKLKQLKKRNPEGKKVVIADDSLFIHYYLAGFFVEKGLKIDELAKNGEEAVYFYKKSRPALITLDKTMPLKSGLEAAGEIVDYDRKAKILFITALGDMVEFREEAARIVPAGNFAIISKPVKEEELAKALEALLG